MQIIGSVLVIAFFGTLAILRFHQNRKHIQVFRDQLTMFKKPPPDAVKGGHWHSDGTWHNELHSETQKHITIHKPKTIEKPTKLHPHGLLTDEEQAEVHREEQEDREKALKYLADSKRRLAASKAMLSEEEQAYMEQQEFIRLIPNFQKQILEYEDYDFILTYPTPVEIIEKFPIPESLDAFCKRLKEFQSLIIQVSDEIYIRPAFARRMHTRYPDFMKKIIKVSELEIPQLNSHQSLYPDDEGNTGPNDDEGGPNTNDDDLTPNCDDCTDGSDNCPNASAH